MGDEEIAGYISKDLNKKKVEHIFIVIHGRKRDGDDYWKMLDHAISDAKKDGFEGADRETAVLAPQFFSTKYNSGQYKKNQLAWDDLNAWQPGGRATHPAGTTMTSFDVIDGLIDLHSDTDEYPSLKNITVVGHGGGGQLGQRYAALGQDAPDNIHVRYIHGDPSSCMYFTEDRPILPWVETSRQSCDNYNLWRYGFDQFPGTGGLLMTPKDYFKQYVQRDVLSIVGFEDTGSAGDTSCMANVQGGQNRRARNLIWFRYINQLARTDENLDGVPGEFKDLPDWSDAVDGRSHLRLLVVEDVAHNAEELFATDVGRGALFHATDIEEGWRPNKNKGPNNNEGGGKKGGGKKGGGQKEVGHKSQ